MKQTLANLFRFRPTVLATASRSNPDEVVPVTATDPLPVTLVGSAVSASGAEDTGSSREATQQQVLAAVQALAPLLGSTDGLEQLASTNGQLLAQTKGLLTTLSDNTDDLERLLSALGVTDDNVLAKLEAIRVLTENTNAHMQAANGNSYVLANAALNGGILIRGAQESWQVGTPLDVAVTGSNSLPLSNPHGANLRAATVHVTGGSLCRNIGADATANCPRLEVGDSERLTATQYAAYRVIRASDTNLFLHVEFEVAP